MPSLVGRSLARSVMHSSNRSTNLHFYGSLEPIEKESVILTGKVWDTLPLLGNFQNGLHEKKKAEKPKIGFSVSQFLIITDTQICSPNVCFQYDENI